MSNLDALFFLTQLFPIHKMDLFKQVVQPGNFERLVTNKLDLFSLTSDFPNHEEELFEMLVQPAQFQRLVNETRDIVVLAVMYSNQKEKLLKLLVQPAHFERLVTNERDLVALAQVFPDQTFLKKGTVKAVLAEIKSNSREQKAYTRGAAIGFFDNLLPSDVAYHIGTFLDRKTGANLAQTTRNAAALAQSEHDAILPKPL